MDRKHDKGRIRRSPHSEETNSLPNDKELLDELYRSVRLLLRHSLSSQQGGGVSPADLMKQMKKLDKLKGHDWTDVAPQGGGYGRRDPTK